MRIGLFLGAGASKCAGYPTTKELLKQVSDKIKKLDIAITQKAFLQALIIESKVYDVEKLYSVIDAILALHQDLGKGVASNFRYYAPRIFDIYGGNESLTFNDLYGALKELNSKIREIESKHVLSPGPVGFISLYADEEKSTPIYRNKDVFDALENFFTSIYYPHHQPIDYWDVFSTLQEARDVIRTTLRQVFETGNNPDSVNTMYEQLLPSIKSNGIIHIFTTNYDQVIEEHCEKNEYELINGFTLSGDNRPKRLWANSWKSIGNNTSLCLVKLHGSVTWNRVPGGDIEEHTRLTDHNPDMDAMIFPTLKLKSYDKKPFVQLMEKFESSIRNDIDVLVVVGFSFRDDEITKVIKSQCERGLKVISISPTPGDLKHLGGKVEDVKIGRFAFKKYYKNMFAYVKEFSPDTTNEIRAMLEAVDKF